MGRYASEKSGGTFEQCPVGSHVAVCVELIDLGVQHDEYQGKPNARQQVVIRWETSNEVMEDGQPFLVSAFYTNSLGEKANLRHLLEAWRGRSFTAEELLKFDLQAILGKSCLISVIHNEKGKAKVTGVMQLPKGTPTPPVHNKPKAFWIDEWDQAAFEALPDFFKEKIQQSDEYVEKFSNKQAGKPAQGGGSFDDLESDLPF